MIVFDSSSLILLAKIELIDMAIGHINQKLIISEQVYLECTSKDSFDAKIIEKRVEEKLISRKKILNEKLYNHLLSDFNLGKGEAEAITLCTELNSGLISDDKKAINACKILKIDFTTVPAIMVEFYRRDLIKKSEIGHIVDRLQRFGRYSENIIRRLKEDLK